MPERSFGRMVRYRRTKLGMSQAKLAELVGRSTATVRAWERDQSRPNDPKVLSTLAAILAVDERQLFEKAEVEPPVVQETSPTIEQALATLSVPPPELPLIMPGMVPPAPIVDVTREPEKADVDKGEGERAGEVEDEVVEPVERRPAVVSSRPSDPETQPRPMERQLVGAGAPGPAFVAPPDPYVQTVPTPSLADLSYVEDSAQRQLYRVRTLATLVAVVALFIAFIWAVGEGLGALGDWWDGFVGQLRL